MNHKINIQYFALFREKVGKSKESIETKAKTAESLYTELSKTHGFKLNIDRVQVAINDEFVDMSTNLKPEDRVVFIPPVAGG